MLCSTVILFSSLFSAASLAAPLHKFPAGFHFKHLVEREQACDPHSSGGSGSSYGHGFNNGSYGADGYGYEPDHGRFAAPARCRPSSSSSSKPSPTSTHVAPRPTSTRIVPHSSKAPPSHSHSASGSSSTGKGSGSGTSSSGGGSSSSSGSGGDGGVSGLTWVGKPSDGFVGEQTGGIMSWFQADSSEDSTNGVSWCNIHYDNSMPLFAPDMKILSPSLATWGSDASQWEADAGKWCGLEAIVTYNGKQTVMYIGDAFDPAWVRTEASIDVLVDTFTEAYGSNPNGDKNIVGEGVSWTLTGYRNPAYAFKN